MVQPLGQQTVPVRPAPALGQHVVDHLRRLIITRQIEAGTHLVEKQLSETFDVSRGPVRDALRQLESEGLVESRRRGVFVIGLGEDDLRELYGLRQLLEAEAVRLCIEQRAELSVPEAALRRMAEAAEVQDAAEFARADLEFHSSFYRLSGHRRLAATWAQYRPTFADMLSVTNTVDRDLGPVHQDHVHLLDLVRGGDLDQVLPVLREHIEGSHQRMRTVYGRFLEGH